MSTSGQTITRKKFFSRISLIGVITGCIVATGLPKWISSFPPEAPRFGDSTDKLLVDLVLYISNAGRVYKQTTICGKNGSLW